ncbi:MAG: 50S ribosomal protein L25 [Gemmatimonadota bacterium]
MAVDTKLATELRSGTGKGVARKLRAAGRLPAVVYGGDSDPVHLSLDTQDADYLFRNISVDNTIVDLEIEGEKEPVQTLVREIQTHPWKATLVHVDFLRIQKGVMVDVNIPLQLVGTPEGVQIDGGQLDQIIYDLPIRCIPSKIPEVIEVDVSHLNLNDVMHISDVNFEEGIEVTIAQERTICSVSLPQAAETVAEDDDGEGEEAAEGAAPAEESSGDEG